MQLSLSWKFTKLNNFFAELIPRCAQKSRNHGVTSAPLRMENENEKVVRLANNFLLFD